jgi:hypothetical protein
MDELDDNADSAALAKWQDRLDAYLRGQSGVEDLRSRSQPHPPWPDLDSPMVGYLIERALEIFEQSGPESAITWAVVHAWFESTLETRASLIRHLGS